MSKDTRIVPNGIYERKRGEAIDYATCINVRVEGRAIKGTMSIYGYPNEHVTQGSPEANTWRKRKWMPGSRKLDIGEFIDDVVDVIEGVSEATAEVGKVVKVSNELTEAFNGLRKPGQSSKK